MRLGRDDRHYGVLPADHRMAKFKVHFLDMGKTMYGDAILCEIGNRRILIDGGHPGDDKPKPGRPSIPEQMKAILGGTAPFHFDLLVVTHCHLDHIGCLPALVSGNTITAAKALVADPDLGWGITGQDAIALPLDDVEARALAAAREEDLSRMPPDELEAALIDGAKLRPTYLAMLDGLAQQGTEVVRYRGPADGTRIKNAFPDIKLTVLGPTKNHLKLCAGAIQAIGRDALDSVRRVRAIDSGVDVARFILSDISVDSGGLGAALNNQSIILGLEANGRRVLLTGDMQLAAAEMTKLEASMGTLFTKLKAAGPWDVVKTPHHTSYNGVDAGFLAGFPKTNIWAHSGGSNDDSHPEADALQELKALNSPSRTIKFARTDRNGLISMSLGPSQITITKARGTLTNYSVNTMDVPPVLPAPVAAAGSVEQVSTTTGDRVEIRTFVPLGANVRVTFQVETDGTVVPDRGGGAFQLAGGRKLPRQLFVTDAARLREHVGPWADACLAAVQAAGHTVFDLKGESKPEKAVTAVRKVNQDPRLAGVVLLGGPTVVPVRVVDALPAGLRKQVTAADDPDDFYVWSDEPYADRDGDDIPELPVTRIPDVRSAEFMKRVLSASPGADTRRPMGYRNIHRPFADEIYATIKNALPIVVSEQATPETIGPATVVGDKVYIMLHGSDTDGSRFWGETADAQGLLAFTTENVGGLPGATVFTGCCWGAMAWSPMARRALGGVKVVARGTNGSLALRFLEQGARAFVGCTGAHYSPTGKSYRSAGGPMHLAFWKHIALGKPPVRALFDAKVDYTAWMQSKTMTAESLAISFKILREYTCLGLGW